MTLEPNDSKLFYELIIPLMKFANDNFQINPNIPEDSDIGRFPPSQLKVITDYIWTHTKIIDKYMLNSELPDKKRMIVCRWKKAIHGNFIVERHLKKGTVFISEDLRKVFMVSGINSTIAELIAEKRPPVLVNTTLLPFRDTIITDGLIENYAIDFGGEYRKMFKDVYMNAKSQGTIISAI